MGKIAISLSRLIERTSADVSDQLAFVGAKTGDQSRLLTILQASLLQTTQDLLEHSPASFRATVPTLKPILSSILLSIPSEAGGSTTPFALQQCVADLLAALHLIAGKAQSPQAWGKAIKEALGGVAEATSAITRDGWEEGTSFTAALKTSAAADLDLRTTPVRSSSRTRRSPCLPHRRCPSGFCWTDQARWTCGRDPGIVAIPHHPTCPHSNRPNCHRGTQMPEHNAGHARRVVHHPFAARSAFGRASGDMDCGNDSARWPCTQCWR